MAAALASWELPDVLWEAIEAELPVLNAHRGRPTSVDLQQVAAGIFFVLRTGIQWQALPRERFGPPSTVYYYFRQWEAAGVFEGAWARALAAYEEQVGLDWEWQSIDGGMTKAPLGGEKHGPQSDRPGQIGDQAQRAYGRRRDTHRAGSRGRQPSGHEAAAGNVGRHRDSPPPADGRRTPEPEPG